MSKIKNINFHFLYVLADIAIVFLFSFLSFFLGYGVDGFINHLAPTFIYCSCLSATIPVVLFFGRVYKFVTKDFSIFESLRTVLSVFIVNVVGFFCVALIPTFQLGFSYFFIWLLSTISICFLIPSVRLLVRFFKLSLIAMKKEKSVPTVVVGAGVVAKVVFDETVRNINNYNKVVCFVDDDNNKIGGLLAYKPIEGPINNIAKIVEKYHAQEVIIAISDIDEARLREIILMLNELPVRIKRAPMLSEMDGPNDSRIINVDLDDLLNRNPVDLDNKQVSSMLKDQTVLVTGAGGSIGSELVRQIFNARPKTLILFDIYENSTYEIQMELMGKIRQEKIDIDLITLIGSTYNETRVEHIIKKYRPDYIYHAAAYKHVPLMEDSPAEAIRTNVIGTYNVAKYADKYKVKKMVLVSTDKAVRPTNVMGATKRFAETIIQYYADKSKNTAYAAVRFGNVLGSNGSVVPLFKKQIEQGGPITLTHNDIIRYFMTIPEAVSLILQCGLFASGGEIFVLDMGEPVRIRTLAERLIRQAGLVPNKDIEIIETGLRPGEKLYEELILDVEHQTKTANNKIYIERKEDIMPIEEEIKEISKVFDMEETRSVKELLSKIIVTYTITENK